MTRELEDAGYTLKALDHWLDKGCRCPLVIETQVIGTSEFQPLMENVGD